MKIFILAFLFLLSFTCCLADWPVKRGRVQLIPTYSMYYSTGSFDSKGNMTSLSNDGDHFQSNYYGLYTMYGITDRLDLLVNTPLISQNSVYSGYKFKKSGLGDMSVGLAYHIPSQNLKTFLTLKGAFIFPGYNNTVAPFLGYSSRAFQLGASLSSNPNAKTFLGTEVSYTRYFDEGTGPSQYLFSGTFGYYFDKWDKLTFNFTHQLSLSSDNSFSSNLAINRNFTMGKVTLGYSRRITRTLTPSLQFYFTPYGFNTGIGRGINLFMIIKLP